MIVTLTTDYGLHDYYAAALKGSIISHCVSAVLIDISHQIKPYDIVQAAFMVRHSYRSFPTGSVHLIAVDNQGTQAHNIVAVYHDEHYFIAPNNGVLSLILGERPTEIYRLSDDANDISMSLNRLAAKAIAQLADPEQGLAAVGTATEDFEERISLQPVVSQSLIRGVITHIDNYENASTNIHRSLYERVAYGRAFDLYFQRHSPISVLSLAYGDVPVGETLCRFNAADYLEIAVNMGCAATLLDLSLEKPIQVVFR